MANGAETKRKFRTRPFKTLTENFSPERKERVRREVQRMIAEMEKEDVAEDR